MHFVFFINGLVLLFFASLMGLTALLFQDTAAEFLTSAVISGLIGALLCLTTRSSFDRLQTVHTFLLTSSVWMTAAAVGALPLFLWSLSPVDAFFEAMSGITTTGSTVMTGLDGTARGIIFWRAVLQAVGGVGFIVTGIALLPILNIGGMQLFRTESSDKGEKELRNATLFATATLKVYLGLMSLCAFIYFLGGMNGFDAITHAMTTLSTGGYSGYDASFGHFQSPFLEWTATFFMFCGSLPFAWYIRVVTKRAFRSEQVSAMVMSLTVVILSLSAWLVLFRSVAPLEALRMVAFNVVSVVSTTGFATTDYTLWGPFAAFAFFALTSVGGCTGSTAGGAKAMRWLILKRSVGAQLQMIRSPHRMVVVRYEGQRINEDVWNGVITFFAFYFLTFAALAIALDLLGLDFSTAISGALTALANVGPGVGPIIGPAGNFATLSDPVKMVLSLGMYLGRLEMVTVFVLLMPVFWREVRSM